MKALPVRTLTLCFGLVAFAFWLGSRSSEDTIPVAWRRIGWQANQAAFTSNSSKTGSLSTSTTSAEDFDSSLAQSYPNVWNPYAPNPNPISDLHLISCTFPPSLWSESCTPLSTPSEDAIAGPWVRVDKDLNKHGVGLWYLYLYYRRKANPWSTAPVVSDILFLTPSEAKSTQYADKLRNEGYTMLESSLRSGIWNSETLNLWYKKSTTTNSSSSAITELDVVYGSSPAVREGWFNVGQVSNVAKRSPVTIQARRTPARLAKKPDLTFTSSGNFTLLQIADLHFSVEQGACRDIVNETACIPDHADNSSLSWLKPLIQQTNPHLIVLSGDQLNGQKTSWDASSVINKLAAFFEEVQKPWTVVYGNHDSQSTDLDRAAQMKIYEQLPYFVGSAGPADVDGVGNYLLPIKSNTGNTTLFNLYFLDSHANKQGPFPWSQSDEYDWIKQSQIDWFKKTSASVKSILRPYSPASSSTSGKKRQSTLTEQTVKKPNAMLIFHIPLPEAYSLPPDVSSQSGRILEVGTVNLEGNSAPTTNSGFFEKAILAQTELGSDVVGQDALPEVKVTVHGHSHLRDACSKIKGVWMCFSGGSSYAGYGLVGFDRRIRVYQLSDYGETISTYKLLDGSGAGARESGLWASASASAWHAKQTGGHADSAQPTGVEDVTVISNEEFEGEADALVEEMQSEQDRLKEIKPTNTAQASNVAQAQEALEDLIDQVEVEEIEVALADASLEDDEKRSHHTLQKRARQGIYEKIDEVTLIGKGAFA